MHQYFIKTPWIAKQLFSSYVWSIDTSEREVYLTFDDGPHPTITPWVLDELKKYNARASFFCIGNNVRQFPAVYQRIQKEGHAVGNHTYQHLNGWKADTKRYLQDIAHAAALIQSNLFRPPYGRIKARQAKHLTSALNNINARVIMWDVLSADFDQSITAQQCLENVLDNYADGSIIVFHDSEKAFPHLQNVLPKVLEHLQKENYKCSELKF
jgi:peptidoglycan/xylan/chitin deacetylase (PgdA/CDA1 family)